MYSGQTIAALGICTLFGIGIPIGAVISFKRKFRESWLPAAFIGAGTFLVFAMILEQILHSVMIPLVNNNLAVRCIYGALAAGIFEETGRFAANKALMRKHYSDKNAVLMGLGHGGCEALIILGITMLSYFILALFTNAVGKTAAIQALTGGNAALEDTVSVQLASITKYGFANMAVSVYERVFTMAFHVCMSVWVMRAAAQKGKVWLFPAAVVTHAAVDMFAMLYQIGKMQLVMTEIFIGVFTLIVIFVTVKFVVKKTTKAER